MFWKSVRRVAFQCVWTCLKFVLALKTFWISTLFWSFAMTYVFITCWNISNIVLASFAMFLNFNVGWTTVIRFVVHACLNVFGFSNLLFNHVGDFDVSLCGSPSFCSNIFCFRDPACCFPFLLFSDLIFPIQWCVFIFFISRIQVSILWIMFCFQCFDKTFCE